MPKILVACEESQAVTKELRALKLEAYSCDIKPCSGGHPEWHIKNDIIELLTQLDMEWDMIIAFPPCTHLAASGARWFAQKQTDGRQKDAIDFFMFFAQYPCPRIAIENPVGIMSKIWRQPDQIIHPYQFGDPAEKRTCLWLKNLPKLTPTNEVDPDDGVTFDSGKKMSKWYNDTYYLPKKQRAAARSKTFPGIAKAMAEQWGSLFK